MRCFFCDNIIENEVASLSREDEKHLFKTLRARPGELIQLNDGAGCLAEAEILKDRQIIVRKAEKYPEPAIKLNLYVAPPRRNKMDTLLKQCAEIGIFRIIPIITENSVATPDGKSDRQQALLREGCKQSRNPFLPRLENPISFNEALSNAGSLDAVFYGAVAKTSISFPEMPLLNTGLFVGPEGGFSNRELDLMANNNFYPLSFGPWILRTETAVVAGTALLLHSIKAT